MLWRAACRPLSAGVADVKQTLEHLGVQLGIGAITAALTYLAGADYHVLGPWAAVAQGAAATILAGIHNIPKA